MLDRKINGSKGTILFRAEDARLRIILNEPLLLEEVAVLRTLREINWISNWQTDRRHSYRRESERYHKICERMRKQLTQTSVL